MILNELHESIWGCYIRAMNTALNNMTKDDYDKIPRVKYDAETFDIINSVATCINFYVPGTKDVQTVWFMGTEPFIMTKIN